MVVADSSGSWHAVVPACMPRIPGVSPPEVAHCPRHCLAPWQGAPLVTAAMWSSVAVVTVPSCVVALDQLVLAYQLDPASAIHSWGRTCSNVKERICGSELNVNTVEPLKASTLWKRQPLENSHCKFAQPL